MIEKTAIEYREVIASCKALFEKKTRDYGTAWRILRLPSITDQIFIKAQRIRSIQEKGAQRVDDPIRDEFIGIINYCIIALIQIRLADIEAHSAPSRAATILSGLGFSERVFAAYEEHFPTLPGWRITFEALCRWGNSIPSARNQCSIYKLMFIVYSIA